MKVYGNLCEILKSDSMLSLGQREMKFVSVKQGLQTADCIQGIIIRQRNFCEPS